MPATAAEVLQEFELESVTTRRVLERVPSDQLTWKPHAIYGPSADENPMLAAQG